MMALMMLMMTMTMIMIKMTWMMIQMKAPIFICIFNYYYFGVSNES